MMTLISLLGMVALFYAGPAYGAYAVLGEHRAYRLVALFGGAIIFMLIFSLGTVTGLLVSFLAGQSLQHLTFHPWTEVVLSGDLSLLVKIILFPYIFIPDIFVSALGAARQMVAVHSITFIGVQLMGIIAALGFSKNLFAFALSPIPVEQPVHNVKTMYLGK